MFVMLTRLLRENRHRVPLYVEKIVPTCLDTKFRKLFQLSRITAATLTGEFEGSNFYPKGLRERMKILAKKTILVALTYVGTQ